MSIIVNNILYDVTKFYDKHPGGSEILKKYDGKDATTAFKRARHSSHARYMMRAYIDTSDTCEKIVEDSIIDRIKLKLFTYEDYFNIHKTIGVITLILMCTRLFTCAYYFLYSFDYFQYWFDKKTRIFFICLQLLLSYSSLIFHVPRVSNSNIPAIHSMFRLHSIIFATRGAMCSIFRILLVDTTHIIYLSTCIVILTSVLADYVTCHMTMKHDKYKTTRKMPYWLGCNERREKFHKLIYSWAQIGAIIQCISSHSEHGPLSTLTGIQGAAFLMTLCRKGLISNYTYHTLYTLTLMYSLAIHWLSESSWMPGLMINICTFVRIRLDCNKFSIMICIALFALKEQLVFQFISTSLV